MPGTAKKPLENEIRGQIYDYLTMIGAFVWVNHSVGIYDPRRGVFRKLNGKGHKKGTSDIIGIYKTKMIAVEVKRPGGIATKEQMDFLEEVNARGHIGILAYCVDDVIKAISRFSL